MSQSSDAIDAHIAAVDRERTVLCTQLWDEDRWLAERAAHTSLLLATNADPLFSSWEWLSTWWQIFGRDKRRQFCGIAVYRGDRLVGLAPLYTRTELRARAMPVSSLQFVGCGWRDAQCQISEYLDVLALSTERCEILDEMSRAIASLRWNEFAVGFADRNSAVHHVARGIQEHERGYSRCIEPGVSHQADLSHGFDAYLKKIGQSSRRALWSLRHRLDDARIETFVSCDAVSAFVDLNDLHARRWGQAVFSGERLRFHTLLAQRMSDAMSRCSVVLSRISCKGQPVSLLYDIRAGDRQYNLQMGFDPNFDRRVSLGLLHLGYAMEHAAAAGVKIYDFLAGPGKNTDYKRHLGQQRRELSSVQCVRGPILPRLYRWHDRRQSAIEAK